MGLIRLWLGMGAVKLLGDELRNQITRAEAAFTNREHLEASLTTPECLGIVTGASRHIGHSAKMKTGDQYRDLFRAVCQRMCWFSVRSGPLGEQLADQALSIIGGRGGQDARDSFERGSTKGVQIAEALLMKYPAPQHLYECLLVLSVIQNEPAHPSAQKGGGSPVNGSGSRLKSRRLPGGLPPHPKLSDVLLEAAASSSGIDNLMHACLEALGELDRSSSWDARRLKLLSYWPQLGERYPKHDSDPEFVLAEYYDDNCFPCIKTNVVQAAQWGANRRFGDLLVALVEDEGWTRLKLAQWVKALGPSWDREIDRSYVPSKGA